MRVVLVSHDLQDNSMGRTWVLWEALRRSGVETVAVGRTRGGIWAPLCDTPMALATTHLSDASAVRDLRRFLENGDVLYAVKARPGSFGVALRAAGDDHRVMLDVDEDDFSGLFGREAQLARLPRNAWSLLRRRESPFRFWRLQHRIRGVGLTVSNPVLCERFGQGTVVPHARDPRPDVSHLSSDDPRLRVTFVGTPRAHKGINVLRESMVPLGRSGAAMLVLTAGAPADARPWEQWVGTTALQAGLKLVDGSDVVVVPSVANGYAHTQLPAKLIDGMMAGRAIVASDTPPIRWALGDAGMLVAPGSVRELRDALEAFLDRDTRAVLGQKARSRALRMFTFDAVGPALLSALDRVRA